MEENRYDTLLEENSNLKKALSSTKALLDRTLNDQETLKQLHEDLKTQTDRITKDNEKISQKLIQVSNEKKEIEIQFDTTIRNLKIAIEQKQKEIEEVQSKVLPTFDIDMLRIKIINELEIPHKIQIEAKQNEIEKAQNQIQELKRQLEITVNKYDLLRADADKDLKIFKENSKLETKEFLLQIEALREKLEEKNEAIILKCVQKENENLKNRVKEKDSEIEEQRREIEKQKEEKNSMILSTSREIDRERNEKRIIKSENDKMQLQNRQLQEELHKLTNKILSKTTECENTLHEKLEYQAQIVKKEETIKNLNRRVIDFESELHNLEKAKQDQLIRIKNEESNRKIEEKNKFLEISLKCDGLVKEIASLREEKKEQLLNADSIKRTNNNLMQENLQLQAIKKEMSAQNDALHSQIEVERLHQAEKEKNIIYGKAQKVKLINSENKKESEENIKKMQMENAELKQANKNLKDKLLKALNKISFLQSEKEQSKEIENVQNEDPNEIMNFSRSNFKMPIRSASINAFDFQLVDQLKKDYNRNYSKTFYQKP